MWPVRIVMVVVVLSSLFTSYKAVTAAQIWMPWNSYYTVWGHSTRLDVQGVVSFQTYPGSMDVWENSAWVRIRNGTAACSRSRVFDSNWIAIYSVQWWGWPYPIAAVDNRGWIFDDYVFSTRNAAYPMRGYVQVSSEISNGQCAYGGGIGWEKSGEFTAWSHWPTST
jgi:hypothetical protein